MHSCSHIGEIPYSSQTKISKVFLAGRWNLPDISTKSTYLTVGVLYIGGRGLPTLGHTGAQAQCGLRNALVSHSASPVQPNVGSSLPREDKYVLQTHISII